MKRLAADGDPLEVLARVVDFEAFRPTLVAALDYSDGAKGGRPPYDPVVMLKCWCWRRRTTSPTLAWNG